MVSTVASMFSWMSIGRNATLWGITSPVRTFAQPVVKALPTLLGFIKKEVNNCPAHWKGSQTLPAPKPCLVTLWDRAGQPGPELCQGMCLRLNSLHHHRTVRRSGLWSRFVYLDRRSLCPLSNKGHPDTEITASWAGGTRIITQTFQHWDEWSTRKRTCIFI